MDLFDDLAVLLREDGYDGVFKVRGGAIFCQWLCLPGLVDLD